FDLEAFLFVLAVHDQRIHEVQGARPRQLRNVDTAQQAGTVDLVPVVRNQRQQAGYGLVGRPAVSACAHSMISANRSWSNGSPGSLSRLARCCAVSASK